MATIASDSVDERPARPPISLHPAFPGIVALWFAVLLGFGSAILPAALIERLLDATGLASLMPAAAPPLGLTARAVMAGVAAALGALLGMAVAGRVARAHSRPERTVEIAERSMRPISVHEELGGESLVNGHGLPIDNRRAQEISEDEGPDEWADEAPEPGHDPDAPVMAPPPSDDEWGDDGWDEAPLEPGDTVSEQGRPADDEPVERQEFQPVAPEAAQNPLLRREDDSERRKAPQASSVEPLPFAAPSLARAAAETPQLSEDWATAPLDKLGLVQLVERLGATIERRREWIAQSAAQPATLAPAPVPVVELDAAPPEEAAQAMAAYFGTADPAPLSEDEPPQLSAVSADDDDEWSDDEWDRAEDNYSSLLGIGQPSAEPKGEYVRIEGPADETALPAAAPAQQPADTDAALRSALATLQRLSGAA